MIQLKNQTQSNIAELSNFENSHLSIQLSLGGLAYCVFDKDLVDVVLLKEYEYSSRPKTPEELLDAVKIIFQTDNQLNLNYESVNVSHKNNLATIVPEALYDKDHEPDYLKYSVKLLENDVINVDSIQENESKSVYIPFVNVNKYLKDKYGKFEYSHASSVLISSLIQYQKNNLKKQFFVNVSKNNIDIIYLNNNQLQLFNSFLYFTKEDFLYYILFAMEQLEINPDEQNLTFIGDISKESDLYQIAYTYVRNISFLKVDNHSLSEEFYQTNPHIEKHQYFELLNQF
jgi:hypothetical protein